MSNAPDNVSVPFLVPAAGRGARLQSNQPKALVELAGRPLFAWTLEALAFCPLVGAIYVAVWPHFDAAAFDQLSVAARAKIRGVVCGGANRTESVWRAFEMLLKQAIPAVPPSPVNQAQPIPLSRWVGIHDVARPLVSSALIARVIQAARAPHAQTRDAQTMGAAFSALPCADTLRRVEANQRGGALLDRTRIHRVQTPQVFETKLLKRAFTAAGYVFSRAGSDVSDASPAGLGARPHFSDEAALVQALGVPVSAVRGEWENEKLTWPEQIPWFSLLLAERRPRSAPPNGDEAKKDANKGRASDRFRVGLGFDAHRFADHRALWLGGVRIDHPRGLLGHSDADVVCHAVGDGVLGAVHKGDIGLHFSDRDPRWRDLAGVALLERTAAMARGEGWKILSVDVVVIAEHPPRLADCRNQMERRIAFALGLSNDAVSVKATTSEGMGFVGRKEGIAAQAAVLVGRRC